MKFASVTNNPSSVAIIGALGILGCIQSVPTPYEAVSLGEFNIKLVEGSLMITHDDENLIQYWREERSDGLHHTLFFLAGAGRELRIIAVDNATGEALSTVDIFGPEVYQDSPGFYLGQTASPKAEVLAHLIYLVPRSKGTLYDVKYYDLGVDGTWDTRGIRKKEGWSWELLYEQAWRPSLAETKLEDVLRGEVSLLLNNDVVRVEINDGVWSVKE